MKSKNYILPILLISSFVYSCKTSENCIGVDRNVFPTEIVLLSKYTCGLEKRFNPSTKELFRADSIICNSKGFFESHFYDSNLKKYKRQYIGFFNDEGERIILINYEHRKIYKKDGEIDNIYSTPQFIQGLGEAYEKYQRIVSVNLEKAIVRFPCSPE